jgi:hypothetical protein
LRMRSQCRCWAWIILFILLFSSWLFSSGMTRWGLGEGEELRISVDAVCSSSTRLRNFALT